jgi:hypothetical protein
MSPHRKLKALRRSRASHATGRHGAARPLRHLDQQVRPYLATLSALGAIGWHVTEIRPDRDEPVLWHVTITRYDGNLSITLTDADPDVALAELARYASADEKELPR